MSIEQVGFISDLNALWAQQVDDPTEGAGHIRVIKQALQNTFPNLDGEVTLTPTEMNDLVQGVADCVKKAGDYMTGDLLMTDYKGLDFALAYSETDSDKFARVVGIDDRLELQILDTEGVILNSLVIYSDRGEIGGVQIATTDELTAQSQNILIVEDLKAQGVSGGDSSDATWHKRDIAEAYNGITDASVLNNEITLPAGSYEVEASVPSYASDTFSCRLVDTVGPTTLLIGTSEKADEDPTGTTQTRSFISGTITLAVEATLYIEHYTKWGSSNGLGFPTSIHGAGEVYTQAKFRKL